MKNLVDYSSSDDDDIQSVAPNINRVKLPMPFLDKADKKEANSEDPEAHQMRVRSIPHIEGNWASHVFIDCKLLNWMFMLSFYKSVNFLFYILVPLSENIKAKIGELTTDDLHLIESTHVSLSKTFIVRYHWIQNFHATLQEQFNGTSSQFQLQLSPEIVYFSNDDNTRHFACILLDERCRPIVTSIIQKVDKCLKEFNLPTYYENPSEHVSVLWKLSSFTSEEKSQISSIITELFSSNKDDFKMLIEKISLKIGNKLMEIALS